MGGQKLRARWSTSFSKGGNQKSRFQKFRIKYYVYCYRCRLNFTEDDVMWAIGEWRFIREMLSLDAFWDNNVLSTEIFNDRNVLTTEMFDERNPGLLKTNTIMFGEAGGRGLFPMFSLMNHSCRFKIFFFHTIFLCQIIFNLTWDARCLISLIKNDSFIHFPSVQMRSTRSTRRKSK